MKEFSRHEEKSGEKLSLDEYLGQFKGRSFFYGNASHAFYDVMVWLQRNRPKKKPNIIMPVYIPAKLYRFVLAAGYEPKFYDVPTDLNIDPEEISGLIDDQTQAVFAVHFFGVPVDLKPLKKITTKADVYLIEDCAHSMNGSYKGIQLGSTGDCTLFSTRKMMQFHCGGILVLNSQPWDFEPSEKKRVPSLFTAYHLVGSRVKFTVNNLLKGYSPFRSSSLPYNGYIDLSENHVVHVKMMDRFTKLYSSLLDLDKLVNKRRENFLYLLNGIKDHSFIQPLGLERYAEKEKTNLYSLNKGFSPFSMPVLTPRGSRDRIQQALFDSGMVCFIGWPEAPFGKKGFEQAEILQNCLLELPIHKYIDQTQLKSMVDCLNRLSAEFEKSEIKAGLQLHTDNSSVAS